MICYNGKFYEEMPETVSPLFDCCQFGALVFETMRTYNEKEIFHLDSHLERLEKSAEILGIDYLHDKLEISKNVEKVVKINNISGKNLRIKVFLCSDFYAVITTVLEEMPASFYQQGIEVCEEVFERNFAKAKYPNPAYKYFMSKQPKSCFETIFFNELGFLREGNISNVFAVFDNIIVTPKKNILHGVTRTHVINTAKQLNIKVQEREISKKEMLSADEIFITNTTKEVVSVRKLGIWENNDFKIAHLLRKKFS